MHERQKAILQKAYDHFTETGELSYFSPPIDDSDAAAQYNNDIRALQKLGYLENRAAFVGSTSLDDITQKGIDFVESGFQQPNPTPGFNVQVNGNNNHIGSDNHISIHDISAGMSEDELELLNQIIDTIKSEESPKKKTNFLTQVFSNALSSGMSTALVRVVSVMLANISNLSF
jgi:hypothetical protein